LRKLLNKQIMLLLPQISRT